MLSVENYPRNNVYTNSCTKPNKIVLLTKDLLISFGFYFIYMLSINSYYTINRSFNLKSKLKNFFNDT